MRDVYLPGGTLGAMHLLVCSVVCSVVVEGPRSVDAYSYVLDVLVVC